LATALFGFGFVILDFFVGVGALPMNSIALRALGFFLAIFVEVGELVLVEEA
jgi:hypothetical protein